MILNFEERKILLCVCVFNVEKNNIIDWKSLNFRTYFFECMCVCIALFHVYCDVINLHVASHFFHSFLFAAFPLKMRIMTRVNGVIWPHFCQWIPLFFFENSTAFKSQIHTHRVFKYVYMWFLQFNNWIEFCPKENKTMNNFNAILNTTFWDNFVYFFT